MKKFLLVLVLIFACAFAFTACKNTEEVIVSPLPAKTIDIKTAEDMSNIKNYLGSEYVNYTFSLSNDIDLAEIKQWAPIGTKETPFMAKFIGNSYSINNLTYIGIDDNGEPTVIEECNTVALFGYTQNTTIENLFLKGVTIKCYTSGDYFHVAGLVAYNIGTSNFTDISISGMILLSNIYHYGITYGMDGEIQDDHVVTCDTTQYAGGLVAYSSGSSNFNRINVDIGIANNNYRAVYEMTDTEEGYYIHRYNYPIYLPSQTIAGIMGGFIKNGAQINNITVTGNIEIYAKSVYAASGIATLIESRATNITATGCELVCKASEKVGVSGIIALLDSSNASKMKVNTLLITAEPIADSIKNISIGGISSYCYDRTILTESEIVGLSVTTTEKENLQLGGIVGVVRDATVASSSAQGTFIISDRKVELANYSKTASIVYAVYGNSIIHDNSANIDITLALNGVKTIVKNTVVYGISSTTSYVNEDGKPVTRFANTDDVKNYVEVYVSHDNANEIVAVYCNNEGVELSTITFIVDDSIYTANDENCIKYMAAYYSETLGLLDASGAILTIGGRSFADYIQITGVPIINDNIVTQ